MTHMRAGRRRCAAALLALALALVGAAAHDTLAAATAATTNDSTEFVIDANTKLRDVFQCSRVKAIGFYNEYFVTCTFSAPVPQNTTALTSLQVRNVELDGAQLTPYAPVHVELLFKLNSTLATVTLDNSSIRASAVEIAAAAIELHATASVNVSARGLKFGPGFNSRTDMGGSHGGIGGASLTLLRRTCERIPPNEFFRAIGDAAGDVGDFQGYGSGGGNDHARGGGRVRLVATRDVVLNGSVLANGGAACTDCSDSAGAGGTIVVKAGGRIYGSGVVHASGGEPALFDDTEFLGAGGGGGGGGGRIVLDAKVAEELDPSHVVAFGGGSPTPQQQQQSQTLEPNPLILWCQLGGDGTILKVQHTVQSDDADDPAAPTIGSLVIKGGRLKHEGPVRRIQIFGCTPIFDFVSSWQRFLPDSVAHIFISGGATVCASYVRLQPSVSGILSSLVLDAGSQMNALEGNRSVQLVASQLTIQGFVGPSTQSEHDLFELRLEGADVSISNGLLLVELLDIAASGSLALDKYSVIKFRFGIAAHSERASMIEGFLQLLEPPSGSARRATRTRSGAESPFVRLESAGNVTLRPQPAQFGALAFVVQAGDTAVVDMPLDAPVQSLSVAAKNATVTHVSSGPLRQCEAFTHQGDERACTALTPSSPYGVSVFAKSIAQLGNISAGSILLCSDGIVSVRGTISSRALGCGSGTGPGNSSVVGGASGGAGHGGRGGNVQPGNTGGGAAYDVSASEWTLFSVLQPPRALGGDGDGNDKSEWPLWPGSGASSGDTPDQIVGGSGGGVIYIGTAKLEVTKDAVISVRGGDGSRRGGGGSGGSMALFIAELSGGGVIDVGGGEATNPSHSSASLQLSSDINSNGLVSRARASVWSSDERPLDLLDDAIKFGGGGGGGIIRVRYRRANNSANNGEHFIQDGGKLLVQGGRSIGGEAGGAGITAALNCDAGRGDVFCLQCPEGTYSPGALSRCLPCEPGSCSSHTGASKCDLCAAGTFNADFGKTQCVACPVGHAAAATGSKACAPCSPGRFAAATGSAECALCPLGTISTAPGSRNCTLCGIGETTQHAGATVCATCRDKPVHSHFNVRGNCTYACEKGRNGLDCLTPFERLVQPIGGPLGFVLLVFSLLGVIFGAWGFLSYRSAQHQKHRFAEYKAQTLRDQLSLANLTRHLTPRLTDQDLDAHLARLYFTGENHLESSWILPASYLPAAMREIVYEGLYLSFATRCNALLCWDAAGWDAWLYRVLLCAVPPLGTLFKRRRQLRRVEKLAAFVADHGASFFREMNFRVHGAKLKIGFSPDFSLAYLDVLVPTGIGASARESSTLMIVVAGSGSFFRPFHIDTNDSVVRAVPARLELLQHDFWINFVADVNEQLRVVPQPTTRAQCAASAHGVRALIAFIDAFNARHVDDGFAVAFGYFDLQLADASDECFARWELARVDDVLAGFAQNPFKLAFQVVKSVESAEVRATVQPPTQLLHSADVDNDGVRSLSSFEHDVSSLKHQLESSAKSDASDPRPADFRFSQIRMEALFADAEPLSPRDSAATHTLLSPTSKTRRGVGVSDTPSTALAALVSRQSLRRVLALLAPLSPLFGLANVASPRLARPWLLPFALLLLLVLDMALVFWILMEYYCIQVEDPTATDSGCSRTALLSVVWILPGAILGAPALGLVFLARKSVFYGKLFGIWTVGSNVNALVAFVCGVAYVAHIREGVFAVVLTLVGIKYAEKQIALRCIAQYACERPLRGWRGLYTTKDWYDSAYTPLVYHEN